MADNSTFITGTASGAFTEAFSGMPDWATEITLNDIRKKLNATHILHEKSYKAIIDALKQGGGGPNAGEAAKEVGKLADNAKKANAENEKEDKKEKKRRQDKDKREKEDESFWGKMKNLHIGGVAAGVLFTKAIQGGIQAIHENLQTYTTLNAAGINLVAGLDKAENGFQGLQQITQLTGVRYTELQASMLKYNTAINSVGVGKFAKTLNQSRGQLAEFGFTNKESADLLGSYLESQKGFTDIQGKSAEETSKELKGFGKRVNDVSQAVGMQRDQLLANIEALSKSTKATLLSNQLGAEQAQKVQEFIASFKDQKLGADIAAMMTDAVKPLNKTFQDLQRSGNGAFGQQEMAIINEMKARGASAEEMQAGLSKFTLQNESNIRQMIDRNNLLAQAGNQEAAAANEHLNSLLQQARNYKELSQSEKDRIAATNKARAEFSNGMEKLLGTFQRIFVPVIKLLNIFGTAVEKLADGFDWIGKKINDFGTWIGETIGVLKPGESSDLLSWIAMLAAGIAAVVGVIKTYTTWLTVKTALEKRATAGEAGKGILGKIFGGKGKGKGGPESWTTSLGADGSGGVVKGPSMAEKIGKAIKGVIDGLMDSITKLSKMLADVVGNLSKGLADIVSNLSKGLGDMISNLSKGIGDMLTNLAKGFGDTIASLGAGLGKGVGALLEGLMKGLAAGLTAFANPMVAIGAAAFAAAILVIGGAIAGATWMVGAALPKFAEGLKSFDNIDGSNLIDVAKGIAALGAAMAVFGVGTATAGVGNVIGSIADGFSKLFGGGSVMDQLMQFTTMGPGLQQAAEGITGISDGMSELSASLSALTGIDKIERIVAAVNSLDMVKALTFGLLGGSVNTGPAQSTAPTSNMKQPTQSTINSPSAVPTASAAPTTEKVAPTRQASVSPEKDSSDASLAAAVSYQGTVLEQILTAINNSVSVNKDILKYTKAST